MRNAARHQERDAEHVGDLQQDEVAALRACRDSNNAGRAEAARRIAPAGAGMPTKKRACQAGLSGSSSITLKRASRSAQAMAKIIAASQPSRDFLQPPEVEDQPRRHAEIDEIGEQIEFGAETRRAFERPRDAAVEPVEHGGGNDSENAISKRPSMAKRIAVSPSAERQTA